MRNFTVCILVFLFFNLVGCHKREVAKVEFTGSTPFSVYKDQRAVKVVCPKCGAENGVEDTKCRSCGVYIEIPESVKCAYCNGTGDCPVCKVFETKGICRFCKGTGKIEGKSCFNCGGSGKCHICKGTQKCDFCGGTGVYRIKR